MATKTAPKNRLATPEEKAALAQKLLDKPIVNKTADTVATTIDASEKALEEIEARLDTLLVGNNKFVPWLKRGPWAAVLIGGVGLAVGAGVAYYLTRKRLATKYDQMLETEIEAAKQHYGKVYKNDIVNASPQELVSRIHGGDAAQAMKEYQGEDVPEPEILEQVKNKTVKKYGGKVEVVEETHTIIEDNPVPGEFDYEKEVALRTPDRPYIITQEEFYQNETSYEQISLTYYDGDDVVVDERDQPLPDPDDTIREDHMTMFGYGSSDPNIVFIRNERLECDFEVVRNTGRYAEQVLGFTDEPDSIKHEDQRYQPKYLSKRERRKAKRRSEG